MVTQTVLQFAQMWVHMTCNTVAVFIDYKVNMISQNLVALANKFLFFFIFM